MNLRPANPYLNDRGRAILGYVARLETNSSKRLLSGQFTGYGDEASLAILGEVGKRSGCWPAIACFDYANFKTGGVVTHGTNKNAISYWQSGGLISIGAHLFNPANPHLYGLWDRGTNLDDLLVTGTEVNSIWMQELDFIASGLQELQAAGVAVLWRPFHEMNGDWFWWGAKPATSFVKMWHHMFAYFTTVRQLNNLIWVYAPNHGKNPASFFPGSSYVDIVGLDAYGNSVDSESIQGYDDMTSLGKPFGFSEFGPHGSTSPPGDYDYRRFIAGIERYFPRSSFFICWNAKWSLASNHYVSELLRHPWVVNRDDIPPNIVRGGNIF